MRVTIHEKAFAARGARNETVLSAVRFAFFIARAAAVIFIDYARARAQERQQDIEMMRPSLFISKSAIRRACAMFNTGARQWR